MSADRHGESARFLHVAGDHVAGDKVYGDKVYGDKNISSGADRDLMQAIEELIASVDELAIAIVEGSTDHRELLEARELLDKQRLSSRPILGIRGSLSGLKQISQNAAGSAIGGMVAANADRVAALLP